jgi:SNF2 family DNA or RNA helicase
MDKSIISNNSWMYSTIHNTTCKVLEEQVLWGKAVSRIWLPSSDAVVKVPKESLHPINLYPDPEIEKARICYVASAAKVADILETSTTREDGPVLLALMNSKVIPLPHQIHALSRAIANDRVRYLLADEVGLGKTIEAGLILRELKLRGLVKRTLVVSPKGIASQWGSEMQTHFNERFEMILGEDLKTLQRISETRSGQESISGATPWTLFDQVVVSLERDRGEYFYQSRQKAIELIGLPEVRQYRLRHLQQEKSGWKSELKASASVIPEIRPLLLLSIGKEGGPQ